VQNYVKTLQNVAKLIQNAAKRCKTFEKVAKKDTRLKTLVAGALGG